MQRDIPLCLDPTLVRPLHQVQNEFVQVLLSTFQLRRQGVGLTLEVEFGFETPAIWLREGKAHLRSQLDGHSMARHDQELKSVLLGDAAEDYKYSDSSFPFRFGNGGTLPVIRVGDEDHYCLFYRDAHPIGWNIANGGAESVGELLDPAAIIERELREELIIIEPDSGDRYVFEWSEGRRADHPDFSVARRIWEEMFREREFAALRELALPLKWLPGPDSALIRFDNRPPAEIRNCLLNVNAEDFGIEIDRVAKMSIGPRAVLCDGEVVRGHLLNRLVGLFRVERFNAAMASGGKEYYPDRLFWSGREHFPDDLIRLVIQYLDDVERLGIRAAGARSEWESTISRFAMCPVAETVIKRYLRSEHDGKELHSPSATVRDSPEVFLSFSSEDRGLAQRVFESIRSKGPHVFFSDETLNHANFSDAIDDALRSARAMVVVGTQVKHLFKPWVRYEWQSFHNDILACRKPWNTPLVTVMANPNLSELPRPLAFRQVLSFDPGSPQLAMQKLEALLIRGLEDGGR
jgi:hypothetical protein